jgi:hypothetical protein
MMAIFSIALRNTGSASGAAAAEIIAGANNAYRLLEMGITINAATTSVFGYGSPAAKGTTPATSSTVQAEDSGNTTAGNTQVALSWTTGPTIPANFLRRVSLPATIGAGIVWTFPRGRTVLKTITDVLWNVVLSSPADIWVVVDE